MRLGILGSTRGTNLQAIIDAIAQNQLKAQIATVISNKQDAYILQRAQEHNAPHYFVDPINHSREEYDEQLTEILRQHEVDLIVLIGYMRILSAKFTRVWKNKIINIHPSLLPSFAGLMDLEVHKAVLSAGETETGCTVHFVTETVDAGPVILQKKCSVFAGDTPEALKKRVQNLEGSALVDSICLLSQNG